MPPRPGPSLPDGSADMEHPPVVPCDSALPDTPNASESPISASFAAAVEPFWPFLLQVTQASDFGRLVEDSNLGATLTHHCLICGTWCNRCQEMNLHYRLHHPTALRGALARGAQITQMTQTTSPCTLCHKPYRRGHCCPVATQVAMLHLHHHDSTDRDRECRTCIICNRQFDTMGQLHHHLASHHDIQVHDWCPSRDALMCSDGCAHCGAIFESRSGLQRHIVDGRCELFDPDASPQPLDYARKWMEAMQQGDFTRHALTPSQRQDLTLVCQLCGTRYSRQNDLGSHLQQAHSPLWMASQEVLRFLIQCVQARHGCQCNPCCNDQGKTHICMMFRQIAMMYFSSVCDLLVPTQFAAEVLDPLLHPILHLPMYQPVRDVLFSRQFYRLWHSPGLAGFLKQWCIHCGDHFHPAELVVHHWQRHHDSSQWATQIKFQIIACLLRMQEHDVQCNFCGLMLNPPRENDRTCSAERMINVQTHFSSNCPIAHQAALLLLPIHGHQHGNGPVRSGAAGVVQAPGTPAASSKPIQARKRRGAPFQAPQTGGTCRRRYAKSPPADTNGNDEHDEAHGGIGTAAREESATTQPPGLLRFLCPSQSARSSSLACRPGDRMEDAPQAEPRGSDSSHHENLSSERHGQRSTPEGEENELLPSRGGLVGQGGFHRGTAEGRVLDLSTVESRGEASHPCGQDPSGNDQGSPSVSAPRRAPGGLFSCGPLSCAEGAANGDTMVPPDLHEAERGLAYPHGASAAGPLESTGAFSACAHADAEQTGLSAAPMSPTSQWQCQGQRQGEEYRETSSPLTDARRHQLRSAFRSLNLDNGDNLCYANSSILTFLWAVLSRVTFQDSDWGDFSAYFCQLLLSHDAMPLLLSEFPWFQQIIHDWTDRDGQADSAEFTGLLLRRVAPRCCSNYWERRVNQEQKIAIHDRGDPKMPITLQIDMELLDNGSISLAALLRHWHQELGMSAGLVDPHDLVCLHIDRFVQSPTGQLRKAHVPIDFLGDVTIPHLTTGIGCTWHPYQVVAAFAHTGDACRGHYQALLRVSTEALTAHAPVRWLHCDDNRTPRPCLHLPPDFASNATCFWICRQGSIDLHDMRLPCLDGHPMHEHGSDNQTQAMLTLLQTLNWTQLNG